MALFTGREPFVDTDPGVGRLDGRPQGPAAPTSRPLTTGHYTCCPQVINNLVLKVIRPIHSQLAGGQRLGDLQDGQHGSGLMYCAMDRLMRHKGGKGSRRRVSGWRD